MKTQELKTRVAVIGAGASGLMCAVSAFRCGAQVTLYEKNRSERRLASEERFDNAYMGKKLLITGKGRCNVTNNCDIETFLKNVPVNPKFLYAALNELSPQRTMEFFEDGGCRLKTERGQRVFPTSDKSADVLRVFKELIGKSDIRVVNRKVTRIITDNGAFAQVEDETGEISRYDACVICTGGVSYPVTGSDGDGYRFALQSGHTVKKAVPSLVPLTSDDKICGELQGLSLKNVTLNVIDNKKNKKIFSRLGEMLFTHYGVSGPLVLSASAHMRDIEPGRYTLSVDLKPSLDEKTLDARILSDFEKYINRDLHNALKDLLPSKLIAPFIAYCGLCASEKPNGITKEQRKRMVSGLKGLEISVSGTRPIEEAVITSGGVSVKDVNPSTMESKKVSGLYFAGEVLDVDAYTGGFNLQIAFSTGFLAGKSAAEAEKNTVLR